MKYQKSEAKEHAREHLVGVWAANLTPFDAQGQLDEAAYRDNLRHWIRDLQLPLRAEQLWFALQAATPGDLN